MNSPVAPKLPKWPFFAADLLLLALAIWIVSRQPHPLAPVPLALVVGCVVAAAFLGVWPFRLEYAATEKLAESGQLTNAVEEIKKLERVAEQVRSATGQWQSVQEHSTRAVGAAQEIGDRMAAEARAFADFMQKANDSEKAHLRLETEKLRRVETEWLHAVIRLLDHIYALQQAGVRSGQRNLVQQLTTFQDSCRDITRRLGLNPLEAIAGEVFDAAKHQLMDGLPQPPDGVLVEDTLATGHNFQGKLLRRALVTLQDTQPAAIENEGFAEISEGPPREETSQQSDASVNAPTGIEDQSSEPDPEQSFRLETDSLLEEESPDRRDA